MAKKSILKKTSKASSPPLSDTSRPSNPHVERRITEYRGELNRRIKLSLGRKPKVVSDLAAKLDISRSAIYSWISGNTVPDVGRLPLLAESLGVSLEWLVGGKGSPEGGPAGFIVPRFFRDGAANLQPPLALNLHWLRAFDHELMLSYESGDEDFIIIEVLDDSMEPTLKPSDLVVSTCGGVTFRKRALPANGLYVTEGLQIRRLEWRPGRKARVLCDNAVYGSREHEIAVEETSEKPDLYSPGWLERPIVGRVLWYARRP
jgi:transcriptional regulator with XRE-family HTH domain